MKILIPEPSINDLLKSENGDSFGYLSLSRSLTKVITSANQHLVIGLANRWGEGKTTFLKMWEHSLHTQEIPCLYIDAFQYEVTEDPFFPLCSKIGQLIPEDKQAQYQELAKKITIRALKFAGAATVKILTTGLSDGGLLEKSGVEGDLGAQGADLVETGMSRAAALLDNNAAFKDTLEESLSINYPNSPVIVIIDELDRCRPDYALSFLERIKHLFNINNLVFVIAVNREQLYQSVSHEYGTGVDPHQYMQKFFSFWTSLPSQARTRTTTIDKRASYIEYCIQKMEYDAKSLDAEELTPIFNELAFAFKLTLRDLQKCLVSFAFVVNNYPYASREFLEVAATVSVINTVDKNVRDILANGNSFMQYHDNSRLLKLSRDNRYHMNMNRQSFLIWFYLLEKEEAGIYFKKYEDLISAQRLDRDWVSSIVNSMEIKFDMS